jgi:hypothetical protein
MDEQTMCVELQIWREEGDDGAWRCRVITPGARQAIRLDDTRALSDYIVSQIEWLQDQRNTPAQN